MSDEELKKTLDALEYVAELTSTKESALAFLVECGILTTSGELTEPYRQNA